MIRLPRRILYLAKAPFFSGAERALVMTLRALDRARYEPAVIAGTEGEFAAQVRALDIPCRVIPLRRLEKTSPIGSCWAVARVIAAAARLRPALIHSNDMQSYAPGGYASRVLGVPVVSHLRFPGPAEGYAWFFQPRFTEAIFISEAFRREASEATPELFNGRSVVVYDGVEIPDEWPEATRLEWRQRLGLPTDRVVIALTGQVSEIKGIWEFVEAAHLLRDTSAVFAVLGDDLRNAGALRREMEERVAQLGLADRFHFLGFRPDAAQIIRVFDIVAVPSHIEPFGLASLEAMASGRPVVASRVGGIPEVVVVECGILVPPWDADALAAGLRRLVDDPRMRDDMGRAGRRRAREQFGLPVHAKALDSLYDRLLGSRS